MCTSQNVAVLQPTNVCKNVYKMYIKMHIRAMLRMHCIWRNCAFIGKWHVNMCLLEGNGTQILVRIYRSDEQIWRTAFKTENIGNQEKVRWTAPPTHPLLCFLFTGFVFCFSSTQPHGAQKDIYGFPPLLSLQQGIIQKDREERETGPR